ncbi:MAG: hypothetical protein U0N08_07280 [Oscillospiraceae bacterium]
MGNTNPYLTAKAVAKKRFTLPIVMICALFGAAVAYSTVDLFLQGEMGSGVISCFLFAATMTPVYRYFCHTYRRISARHIAEALIPLSEEILTFDQLQTVLSSEKAIQQIKTLIGKGYLQNLQIDLEERTVGLYVPEDAYAQWVCSNCGAKNRARKGGALRCKYCDQPMTK